MVRPGGRIAGCPCAQRRSRIGDRAPLCSAGRSNVQDRRAFPSSTSPAPRRRSKGGEDMNRTDLAAMALAVAGVCAAPAPAAAHDSVGRGWPVTVTEAEEVGAGGPFFQKDVIAARDGDVPEGIEPLERDLFTSPDFYADR